MCKRGATSHWIVSACSYLHSSQLRHFAQKRLTTTVEEDSSNREYYDEVKVRLILQGLPLDCTGFPRSFQNYAIREEDLLPVD